MNATRQLSARVHGLVQGVGFRPHAWRLARRFKLQGEVGNDTDGVFLHLQGRAEAIAAFLQSLRDELPPLARIDRIDTRDTHRDPPWDDFRIVASTHTDTTRAAILPDAATCADCQREIDDANDRRHDHPFSNCTHCGPRLSIIRALPYDRDNTSMAGFPMCPDCAAEYRDPSDRRFHAQANACPQCGPRLYWRHLATNPSTDAPASPIAAARAALRAGRIVAIKGIGGFHLACDAGNADAVRALRARKRRDAKPLALMARDLTVIRRYAHVDTASAALLRSPAAPIVLLPRRSVSSTRELAPDIAPADFPLGFMLPYSPLHHVLLRDLDHPLVMTSGNLSEQPQIIADDEAQAALRGIADHVLGHDRAIVNRVDDSVARVIAGRARLLRRARGYAPAPLPLPPGFAASPPLIALGAELKNTFCLLHHGQAILSQHLGDLEDASTAREFEAQIGRYRQLFDHHPQAIAVDAHPRYHASQFGERWSVDAGLPLFKIQHHHAHIAACLAENGRPREAGPVLGIALDGLGYGLDDDQPLWGGEFLLADYHDVRRLAHFRPMPMLGGTRAMLEPWRVAYAHLRETPGWPELAYRHPELAITRRLRTKPLATLEAMLRKGLNVPPSSSAGRLFDAVAACLDLHPEQLRYEAEAAMALEALALRIPEHARGDEPGYRMDIGQDSGLPILDPSPMWPRLLADLSHGVAAARIAARFHNGLIDALVDLSTDLARRHDVRDVALSGGVFQNRYLLEHLLPRLHAAGLRPLTHAAVPGNDGGLSLGQAAIAAARILTPA